MFTHVYNTHVYSASNSISFRGCQEGDDEAAQRWMQKALEEKLEWDAEELRCM